MPSHSLLRWAGKVEELNSAPAVHEPREVWQCELGINVGHEQNGDPRMFTRPVLVMHQFGPHMRWVVPLSTKTPTGSPHHHLFVYGGISYSAVITQLRAIDARRLIRKLYTLNPMQYQEIQLRLARMMLHEQNRTPS